MLRRLWILLGIVTLTVAGSAAAQEDPLLLEGASLPYLSVTSDPPGVTVEVKGQYEFVGTTPWSVFRPLDGLYLVRAWAPGYSPWTRQMVLGPSGVQDLHIKLRKKSRFAAAGRSLLLPGWGQRYNEKPSRGTAFSVAQGLSLIGVYVFWEIYQDKVDDFDRVAEVYRESRSINAIPVLRAELEERDREANDAFDNVERAMLGAAAIYGIAFLDALFNGPEGYQTQPPMDRGALPEKPGTDLGMAADWNEDRTRVGLRLKF